MTYPNPRSVVAVLLTVTVCAAILGPIGVKVFGGSSVPLPEAVIAGLLDLLKVIVGGVIGWLAAHSETPNA